jgi:hypothetical protein
MYSSVERSNRTKENMRLEVLTAVKISMVLF